MSLTQADLVDCLSIAAAVFPQYPLTREQVIAYHELLKDLDASRESLSQAVQHILKTSRFFPTVAEIREALIELAPSRIPARQPYQAIEYERPNAVPMPDWFREKAKEMLKRIEDAP